MVEIYAYVGFCLSVDSLMYNNSIRELYLSQTGLYTKEADCLGKFLSKNLCLKVLDISNNCIGDHGLMGLAKGLTLQQGVGLSVLVIVNNQLTEKSGPTLATIIVSIVHFRNWNSQIIIDKHFYLHNKYFRRNVRIFTPSM